MSIVRTFSLGGIATLLALAAPAAESKKLPKAAPVLASRVELAAGDVRLGEEAGQQPVGTGTMLPAGSTLSVGPGGRCLVRMSDGTGLFLRDGTRVALADDGVSLMAGEAWFDVPRKDDALLEVQAGGTKISAEKAGFDVKVDGGTVAVRVIRGLAVVESTSGRSEVGSGEVATLTAGAPQIEALDFWEDWTGGMADHAVAPSASGRASGRIYAIDRTRAGAPPQDLQIRQQDVHVALSDGIARTEVTQSFFNPGSNPVEGWYWFTIPEGAAVTRFALVVDGRLVDGKVIERKQAAARYEAAVQRAWDPALLEWVDGVTYRARIYPVPAAGERTVVLAYTELLPRFRGTSRYVYPMGDDESPSISEFSLDVDVGDADLEIATIQGARIEGAGNDRHVTMRRSGFQPHGDFLLELSDPKPDDPLRVVRYRSGRNEADYIMARYAPEKDWDAMPAPEGVVVVVVDTSVGGDDGDRKLKTDAAEAILRALSAGDRFALVTADLQPRLVWPLQEGLAQATDAEISKAMERLSEVPTGGALDLGEMFNEALKLVHGASQPAFVYIGDGMPTVGEMRSVEIVERLKRSLSGSPARLFTMAVGMDANTALLDRLASVGGGQALRVDLPEQTVQRAIEIVGAVKTPTITDLRIDLGVGLDEVFTSGSGKVTRGQEVFVYGRTHHPLPNVVRITGTMLGKPFAREYRVSESTGGDSGYAASLWAMENLRYLLGSGADENRGAIVSLGLEYQLMTPFTSFLTLEQEPVADAQESVSYDRRMEKRSSVGLEEDDSRAGSADEDEAPAVSYKSAPGRAMSVPEPADVAGTASQVPSSPRSSVARTEGGKDAGGASYETQGESGSWASQASSLTGNDRSSVQAETCSDASRRSLAVRRNIWARRLASPGTVSDALRVYKSAMAACEIDGWKAERTLLDLVLLRVRSPAEIGTLLASFQGRTKVQDYLRTELLRRVMAPEGLLPTTIQWHLLDTLLATMPDPEKRLTELSRVMTTNPGDPEGLRRMLFLLLELGRVDEALVVANRLRSGGYSAPGVLVVLGDLEATHGDADAARRTYSELVEYNPWDAEARRMLGDVFLRHGWYEDAYRQYGTLLLMASADPDSIIRFARAAAGAERTDEALRTFKKVLELSLEPSTSDPREWARLWSASLLAHLMAAPQPDAEKAKALERSLKRAEVFQGPSTLYLLTWNDLDADLTLALRLGPADFPADRVEAGSTGLVAAFVPPDAQNLEPHVSWGARRPGRSVDYRIQVVRWDGREFKISESTGSASPRSPAPPVSASPKSPAPPPVKRR
jgi:Ca-activated chloride channel homolog